MADRSDDRSNRVLVVCASRDRVYSLDRMIDSALMNSTRADVAVYVDEDQREEYKFITTGREKRVFVTYGERVGPCRSLNALVAAHPGYAAYGAATDDSTFGPDGWDEWVLETAKKFPGQIGAIAPYHENFVPVGSMGTLGTRRRHRMDFPWVTGKWLEVVGWLCCPNVHSFYWDILVELMGEMTQIAYAQPRDFEMMHDCAISDNLDKMGNDGVHTVLCIAFERKEAVARLRQAIEDSKTIDVGASAP